MYQKIIEYAKELDQISRIRRRDFHRYPETAWYEMRTSAIIAKTLTELGYEVLSFYLSSLGKRVTGEGSLFVLPAGDCHFIVGTGYKS